MYCLCACVCLLARLDQPLTINFKLAHISQKLKVCASLARVRVKGYCQTVASTWHGSEDNSNWSAHGYLLLSYLKYTIINHEGRLLRHRWQKSMYEVTLGKRTMLIHSRGRDSDHDLSVRLNPCLCLADKLCNATITCMVCVPWQIWNQWCAARSRWSSIFLVCWM